MNDIPKGITGEEKEALKFLENDFNQCFEQLRYYDAQLLNILKFMFAGYSTIIGLSIGLYKFGIEKNVDFTFPSVAILFVGIIIGLLIFSYITRNRVYFVKITRYINEQRSLFHKFKPLGFLNRSKMYTAYDRPPFFNWHSTQALFIYLIASLNSAILGVTLFMIFSSHIDKFKIIGWGSFLTFLVQVVIAILYLTSQEKK